MSERDYVISKAYREIEKAMPFRAVKRVKHLGNGTSQVTRTPGAIGRRAGMLTSYNVVPSSGIKGAYQTTENIGGGNLRVVRQPGAIGRKIGMLPRQEIVRGG